MHNLNQADFCHKLMASLEQTCSSLKTPELRHEVRKLIDIRVSSKIEEFFRYAQLIISWGKKINLVSSNDFSELHSRHFADSIIGGAISFVRSQLKPEVVWLDVGSGAGLPGIAIALMFPEAEVFLCEPRLKRIHFLKEAISQLKLLNTTAANSRFEDLDSEICKKVEIVITRASGLRAAIDNKIRLGQFSPILLTELTTVTNAQAFSPLPNFLDEYRIFPDSPECCVGIWLYHVQKYF